MNKKIVIFDLDGTLLNTLEDLTDSTNFALSQSGYPICNIEEIRNFVGNGVVKLFERAVPNGGNVDRCVEIFKKHYEKNMYNKTKPYDGILDMLKILHAHRLKIAVVSNKFNLAVKELCRHYFKDLIDFASGEDEINGIFKKPAPDTVFAVLKKFDLPPQEAIYVGDSEVDIQTAKNANMDCISVTWGFKTREFLITNGAKNILENPNEILKYL